MSGGQKAAIVVVTLVLAVGAFLVLRPSDDDESEPATTITTTQQTQATTTTERTTPKVPKVPTIEVKDGQPADGLAEIEVKQGDTVNFQVTTDEKHEIHLHGYDVAKDAAPGKPAKFRLKASETGIFEIEIEDTGTQIAELKVNR